MLHQGTKKKEALRNSELKPPELLPNGWHLRSLKKWQQASELCRTVLSKTPRNGEAWHLLGLLCWDQADHEQAVKHLKQAILVEPHQPLHFNNLGVILNDLKRHSEAGHYLQKALEIAPDYLDAKCNFGLALLHQNRLDQAAQFFKQILSIKPNYAAAIANLGLIRLVQQHYSSAVSLYQKAIAVNSTQSQWHGNLGAAYVGSGDLDRAAACYRNALELEPRNLDHCIRLAIALRSLGRYAESIAHLKTALSIDPNNSDALVNLVIAYEQTCQWDELDPLYDQLDRSTQNALIHDDLPIEDPMFNIRRTYDLALNRAVSQSWSQSVKIKALELAKPFTHAPHPYEGNPITIGYLSYDFRNHPVAHQIFPLFELHDRSRFKVIAFSMGPDDSSTYRTAIESNSDTFIDISTCSLIEAAQTIYDQKVDILIDLMGHSHHNRMGILALRPAPLQVGYLGFLSTTGADFIDYIVADEVVVPNEDSQYFSEHLLRMPHCYQINHTTPISAGSRPGYSREECNLPPKGFTFCCFNVAYKIDRPLFDSWMRILLQTPESVLWLFGSNPLAMDHMRARAKVLGIDPKRIVFATKMPLEEHLKRLPLADLALDTLRYNGGATTSNALRIGLPVLTSIGNHWVSRMSASHLMAAGLPQLVASDIKAYEYKAIDLAQNPEKLSMLRRRLVQQIKTQPLFDPNAFIRDLENGYEAIWNRYLEHKGPMAIKLPLCTQTHSIASINETRSE